MERYIQRYRTKQHALKFNMFLHVNFERAVDPAVTTVPLTCLVIEQFEVYEDTVIKECLQECSQQLQNRNECYEDTGSGWVLSNLVALDITIWLLDPQRAFTYHSLPKWIQNTKCVVNVKNKHDNKCFKYAVLAGLYRPTDLLCPSRVSSYTTHETAPDAPNVSMLTYPVTLRDVGKFERVNGTSINVYSSEKCRVKGNKKQQDVSSTTFTSVVGKKRKSSCQKAPTTAKRRRGENSFIDDEAVLSGDDSGDEESDMEDDTEDFLIDDNSGIEDDVSKRDQVNEI